MKDYTQRTIKTLTVILSTNGQEITAEFYEPDTGDSSRVVVPYSPDCHPEFDDRVGNELYFWINEFMRDQEQKIKEGRLQYGL